MIIKCPECGHQISDRAPVCPSCGVEIAGKIARCPQCGEIFFNDQAVCPNCHHTNFQRRTAQTAEPVVATLADTEQMSNDEKPKAANQKVQVKQNNEQKKASDNNPPTDNGEKPHKRKGCAVLIASFLCALIICGVCFYYYNEAKTTKENKAYEYAMTSTDLTVMQSFLNTYRDASQAHRDSITARMERLKQIDLDWTNALVSGSKTALLDYLAKYPETAHKNEAKRKIDSIDWRMAVNENTPEGYDIYIKEHEFGEYVEEANDSLKRLKAKIVQEEERSAISGVFRKFFQSINSKDENALMETVSPLMTSFLGKQGATKNDVVTFMNKIYKEDITNMNWHINNDYKIDKKEVGDGEYEYTVQFSARQDIERTDPNKEKQAKYRVKAKVGPDKKITEFNMTQIMD